MSTCQVTDSKIIRLASTKKIVDFHLFVDASKAAYCACIFARCQIVNGFESKLIFAKSRVTPLKGITIPRAELLAALIGVRAMKFLQKALRFEAIPVVAWSDSRSVLCWLQEENFEKFPKFVRNPCVCEPYKADSRSSSAVGVIGGWTSLVSYLFRQ